MKRTLRRLSTTAVFAAAQLFAVGFAHAARTAAEPQRHFASAVEAYTQKNYKAAAGEIRAATGELRYEAGRASGDARQALDSSVAELDKLAYSVDKGALGTEQSIRADFARAEQALALEHRSKAAEAWSHKRYRQAGTELKAAAAAAVSDARTAGDKLATGATWGRDEVAKGFQSLGNAIDVLGREIANRA